MLRRKTIGDVKISSNACIKLFLSAASRKILITKEKTVININEGTAEHTSLSKLRSFVPIKVRTFFEISYIFVFLKLEKNFILLNLPPIKNMKKDASFNPRP